MFALYACPSGLLIWPDYLEIEPLKLNAEHFPLPCSLHKRVMARYAGASAPDDADLAMDVEELRSYLRNMNYDEFSPMEGVLAQTEAIGDPALPTREQKAILNWLGAAIRVWEHHFPIEEPLAAQLRRLKPLVAALAVTDASFLTPGAHPLHQLLDTIQLYAIGWQPRLGRAGKAQEEQIHNLVDAALAWFDSPATNLGTISADMAALSTRARASASKMAQRLIETELGRISIAESKRQAALMINAALEQHQAPASIGELLKGPWYDSAQLVLMKFGVDSLEWKDMSSTTTKLLDSLQGAAADDETIRRQSVFESVSQLPNDLSRWLFSLQHDSEAINEIIERVGVFHARMLRKQPLQLDKISPIALRAIDRGVQCLDETLNRLQAGQWFILDTDNAPSLRARLVLRLDDEAQLLFANQVGIKVLQMGFTKFVQLTAGGKVTELDSDASFSRCLASSAGVETQEDLDELTGIAAQRARLKEEERQRAEWEQARLKQEQAGRERAERERQQQEQEKIEQLQRQQEKAERLRQEQEEARRLFREQKEQERARGGQERAETLRLQKKWEEASHQHRERIEQARIQPHLQQKTDEVGTTTGADLNLSVGTWLGFRDGEEAILARLAVFNREQDDYIFVNRYGTKMRQLSGRELFIIITRGLTDILEARSKFRDEVTRIQQQSKD